MILWRPVLNKKKYMQDQARRFLGPENSTHRKYEALSVLFAEGAPLPEAARRFGYAAGTLRNLRAAFLREPAALESLAERSTAPGYRRASQSPSRSAGNAAHQPDTAWPSVRAAGFGPLQRMQRPPGDAKGSESLAELRLGIPATPPAPPSGRKRRKPSRQVAKVPGTHSTRKIDRESGEYQQF